MTVPPWQRRLLPGSMVDAQSTRRTARDWAVDMAMLLQAISASACTNRPVALRGAG